MWVLFFNPSKIYFFKTFIKYYDNDIAGVTGIIAYVISCIEEFHRAAYIFSP